MARTTTRTNDLRAPLYATIGATDRAVELVRDSVSDLRDPQALRNRVAGLQNRAAEVPTRVQGLLEEHDVAYGQLVARGDALARRIRRQKSTQDTVKAARTTSSKAKATATQADEAGRSTAKSAQGAAKGAATTARRRSAAPRSSAKATATGATKTAKSAAKATADAAKKVGD